MLQESNLTAHRISRRRFAHVFLAGGAATLLGGWSAACGGAAAGGPPSGRTVGLSQLTPSVAALYRYVEANQPIAMKVPCYCGCGESSGHRSMRDCFINANGQYDAHAAGCQMCLEIADETQQLSKQGKDVAAIRARIETDFSRYGPATNTRQ